MLLLGANWYSLKNMSDRQDWLFIISELILFHKIKSFNKFWVKNDIVGCQFRQIEIHLWISFVGVFNTITIP